MSKNQRNLKLGSTDVWASEFPLHAQTLKKRSLFASLLLHGSLPFAAFLPMVGVAGFEPATLRLSSACSNQLSYTPGDYRMSASAV